MPTYEVVAPNGTVDSTHNSLIVARRAARAIGGTVRPI
jgi:hypothetical protein